MSVVIFVIFDVVLVTLDVLADDLASSWQYLAGVAVILESKRIIVSLCIFFVFFSISTRGILYSFLIVKGLVKPTEFIVQVDENVSA